MNTEDLKRITTELKNITQNEPDTIRADVAREALERDGEIISFFSDLLQHGCISGMVTSLIYYQDTAKFFDRHYQEIEELRLEHLENFGTPFQIEGDLKNALAWFAFEQTALQMVNELGIEL